MVEYDLDFVKEMHVKYSDYTVSVGGGLFWNGGSTDRYFLLCFE